HTRDQEPLYADLLAVAPNLKAPDIGTFYKDASFVADLSEAERVETFPLRPGTVIIRDKQFGVPHIFGTTRADTEFGAGFASAEDRLFEMDVLRHVGRAQLTSFIGPAQADPSKMPAEYTLLQVPLQPWKPTDIVATATLVQAIFAIGGGNEVASALLSQSLVARYGPTKGSAIWRDLRSQNDPEARTSINTTFSYEQVPPASSLDPRSLAMPLSPPTDNHCRPAPSGAAGQSSAAGVTVDLTPLLVALSQGLPHGSNELIVDAAHSTTGHPIAVFGPQTGYFVPQLLHEIDLHGPGLHARGVSFAGTEVFVELGHGVDYAWSATSAGADI